MVFPMKKLSLLALTLLALITLSVSGCFDVKKDLVVGIYSDDDYPPMEFRDSKGNFAGFDIDVIQAVGKNLKMKVTLAPAKWAQMFDELNQGKYDCLISTITITQERMEKMLFSRPYLISSQVLIINNDDNGIVSFMDLKGKKVICQEGTTGESTLNSLSNNVEFTIVKSRDTISMFTALQEKKVDGIVADEITTRYRINKEKDPIKILSDKLAEENIGICFKKDQTQLRDKVDKALEELKADGSLQKLSQQWFGANLIP